MTGTFLNVAAVLIGGIFGMLFGSRLPERVRQTVVAGLGLFTAAIGIQMFLDTQNPIVVLGSLLVGGLLGEWWQIEDRLRGLGAFLEERFTRPESPGNASGDPIVETAARNAMHGRPADELTTHPSGNPGSEKPAKLPDRSTDNTDPRQGSRFIRGFLTASLVFCIGPMTILGSIQDGLSGDYSLLAIKSVLDGFAALAFASSLGVGVLFSTLIILVYQGGISLLAFQAQALITPPMISEMTAAGGVLLVGIAVSSLLEIKPIRVGNFLPALAIAPLIVAILAALGLSSG